ncbi:MAG: hypothetical protein WBZ37_29695 [Mycobacterium sp.]
MARAHAAPNKLVAVAEIRARIRVESGGGLDDRGGVVIVGPPGTGSR